jgi:hypothetical protein
MTWTPEHWTALAQALAWPAVAAFALIALGPALADGLRRGFALRRVSVFGAEIEFSAAALSAPPPEAMRAAEAEMAMIHIGASGPDFVVEALRHAAPGGAMTVNLGDGDRWLATRLYALAHLGEARGLRAVALLSGGARGGFSREGLYLGAITPAALAFGLGVRFPWLPRAMDRAVESVERAHGVAPHGALLDALAAPGDQPRPIGSPPQPLALDDLLVSIVQAYLFDPEIAVHGAAPAEEPDWVALQYGARWEHGPWLDASTLSRLIWRDLDAATARARGPTLSRDALARIAEEPGELVGVMDGRALRGVVAKAALFDRVMARDASRRDPS